MPVVSAAIAAVAAAIATTTIATVATAVVAVSTVIGVAGLATTAIGMITGNKDILKAGKIMGYVGLAGGLAGGLLGGVGGLQSGLGFMEGASDAFAGASQHLSTAWDEGLGALFSPGTAPLPLGVEGTGTVLAPAETGVLGTASSPYVLAPKDGISQAPAMFNDEFLGGLAQSSSDAISQAGVAAGNAGAANIPPTPLPDNWVAPPSETAAKALSEQAAGGAGTGSATPTAETALAGQEAAAGAQASQPVSGIGAEGIRQQALGQGIVSGTQGITPPTNATDMASWFKNLPPALQASLAITGGQAISGLMGGLFQGLSAEKQLELQKVIADRAEDQRLFQKQNASYAPRVQYAPYRPIAGSGLLNSVKRTA